jgi:hypothetical protein
MRWSIDMTSRSRREAIHFKHPLLIKDVDRLLPPGDYEVITDEEMIESLSFPSFRRVATMILIPGAAPFSRENDLDQFGRSCGRAAPRRECIP